jgi:hypothetical protein
VVEVEEVVEVKEVEVVVGRWWRWRRWSWQAFCQTSLCRLLLSRYHPPEQKC